MTSPHRSTLLVAAAMACLAAAGCSHHTVGVARPTPTPAIAAPTDAQSNAIAACTALTRWDESPDDQALPQAVTYATAAAKGDKRYAVLNGHVNGFVDSYNDGLAVVMSENTTDEQKVDGGKFIVAAQRHFIAAVTECQSLGIPMRQGKDSFGTGADPSPSPSTD